MSPSSTQFQTWQGDRYAYETLPGSPGLALLLIHPIGVGLSRRFWDRFCAAWQQVSDIPLYNPDLLGCGESDLPRRAYRPEDWAAQLQHFLDTVVQRPVVVVAQGGLVPAAIELTQFHSPLLQGLVLSGPPAWRLLTQAASPWQQQLTWGLLNSPLGAAFYRYARRRSFLESFSRKQLFASTVPVDEAWLTPLLAGAADPASRHAVFAFLARFWQKDYSEAFRTLALPTLVLFGEEASSISRSGQAESPPARLQAYLAALPQGQGKIIPGRNVLPYESTEAFVQTVLEFVTGLAAAMPSA